MTTPTHLPRHRHLTRDDHFGINRRALCQCRGGDLICPRHAPNLYTLGGARHRAEAAS